MDDGLSRLTPEQRDLLVHWVPDAEVLADHSWGLVDTTVLELRSKQGRLVLKAGGPADHHIERELRAHREWLGPWVATGHAPSLMYGDSSAKLLVTMYLPGRLVEGTPAQDDPDAYRQAGELLARYHGQVSEHDPEWHDKFRERVERHLGRPHRIDPSSRSWPAMRSRLGPGEGPWSCRLTATGSLETGLSTMESCG